MLGLFVQCNVGRLDMIIFTKNSWKNSLNLNKYYAEKFSKKKYRNEKSTLGWKQAIIN